MINHDTRTHLFVAILILLVSVTSITLQKKPQNDPTAYSKRYSALKQSYIDLAKSHSNLLEVLLRSDQDLQTLLPEYNDVSKEELADKVRRQIRELTIEADKLEKEK